MEITSKDWTTRLRARAARLLQVVSLDAPVFVIASEVALVVKALRGLDDTLVNDCLVTAGIGTDKDLSTKITTLESDLLEAQGHTFVLLDLLYERLSPADWAAIRPDLVEVVGESLVAMSEETRA